MSGARDRRDGPRPFRREDKSFRKPFGSPRPEPAGPGKNLRPWKARRDANEPVQRERQDFERGDERSPSPPKGKFYERFVKPAKVRPDEARDDRDDPRGRTLASSERTLRISSSASRRDYDNAPPRDDYPRRDYRQRQDDFRDRPPRGGYRDERREAPRNYERADDRDRRDPRDYPRGDYRRDERPDARPRREGYDSRPARPAPHLVKRIVRSEGAKADRPPESFAPPPPPDNTQPSTARLLAARVLLRRLQTHAFVEDLLDDALTTQKLRPDDRRLAQEIVYGCVRWQATLDWLREQGWPLETA